MSLSPYALENFTDILIFTDEIIFHPGLASK